MIKKINNSNLKQIDNFLNYLRDTKGKSINTINGYKVDLVIFFRWYKLNKKLVNENINFNNIDISNITNAQIQAITLLDLYEFISYIKNTRGNTNKSICRKVATLKSFFGYLKKIKIVDENITIDLDSPKVLKKEPIYLTEKESIKLLNATKDGSAYSKRNYCLILILLNHGLRVSELNHLKKEDLNFNTKEINILGKGNKYRKVYMNNITENALKEYISISVLEDNILFNITKEQVNNIIKKYCKKAGINKHITAHKLRHTNATITYKKTHDIRLVQANLGHETINTTQIYTHVCDDDRRKYANDVQIG